MPTSVWKSCLLLSFTDWLVLEHRMDRRLKWSELHAKSMCLSPDFKLPALFLFLNLLVMICFLMLLTLMVFRWWAGEWQKCSTTCGPTGQKKRTVLCIQTVGSDEQALDVTECQHLLKPKTHLSCNRDILCPSDWTVSNWTEVNSCQQKHWTFSPTDLL